MGVRQNDVTNSFLLSGRSRHRQTARVDRDGVIDDETGQMLPR